MLAAILLLLWENLSNDVFDAATGVDATGKPHSVVNLTGAGTVSPRGRLLRWCWGCC